MKKLLPFLTILGIFVLAGFASASTANELQPASSLVVDKELRVLGTARAYSIRIGAQGYGGVTFFNGTIINETTDTDTGTEMPVTFGDDVRIDGRIWRGENAGPGLNDDRELIVNDDMEITGDLTVNNLVGTGVVNSNNILDGTITTADLADSSITSAKLTDGTIMGSDISSSADLSVATGTFSGDITAHGDIIQDLADHGAAKALTVIHEDGTCPTQWTYNDSTITCASIGAGNYTATFTFNVYNRYNQLTGLQSDPHFLNYNVNLATPKVLYIRSYDIAGNPENSNVVISVF